MSKNNTKHGVLIDSWWLSDFNRNQIGDDPPIRANPNVDHAIPTVIDMCM